MWAHVYMGTCVWRPEVDLGCFPQLLLTLFCETVSHLKHMDSARQASQQELKISCLYFPELGLQVHMTIPNIYVNSTGIRTQELMHT